MTPLLSNPRVRYWNGLALIIMAMTCLHFENLDEFISSLCLFQAHNKLVELLDAAGIEREMESFSSDPKPALTNLKVKLLLSYCK